MRECEAALSDLPVGFIELPVAEAIDILATNRAVDAAFYWECKLKQEDLTRWIDKQ